MPTIRFLLCTLVMISPVACTSVPTSTATEDSSAAVDFLAPDQFTDVGGSRPPSPRSRDAYLANLRKFMIQEAQRRLPPGERVEIVVTDVDMAGDFEPWRPHAADVRILRDIYPPRIALRFRLLAADGTLLKEGERKLVDQTYLMTSVTARGDTDPLRYEKALLGAWMQKEFEGK
ncbi:MAG: DUF3016 domain-containing protein [Acidovorax sp.]